MIKINIEKIKSYILSILILTSIILTGSLWFDNYHGLSLIINNIPLWVSSTFSFDENLYDKQYEQIIIPYKVMITNGEAGKWSYYSFSSGNNEGWDIVKNILNTLNTNMKIESASATEWQELTNRKSVICEFGGAIDTSVIKLIFPANNAIKSESIPNIEAFAFTKTLSGGLIYIKENEGKIYRIVFNGSINAMEQYIEKYSKYNTYVKLIALEEMGTNVFYGDKKIQPSYNTLFPISNKQEYRLKVPKLQIDNNFNESNISNIDKMVTKIFNNTDYSKFITNDKGYIFINEDSSSIKIEENALFEYTGKKGLNQEEDNSFINSFNAALNFVKNIAQNEEFYLVSTEKNNDKYIFNLGITLKGIPIIDMKGIINKSNKVLMSISVENGIVTSCKANINKFSTKETSSYITYFGHNILDAILSKVDEKNTVEIKNIDLVYDIATDNNYLPMWFADYYIMGKREYILTNSTRERLY